MSLPPGVDRVGVLLSVAPERMDDVLRACVDAGLEDAEQLAAAGVLTGRVRPDRVASLQALPGVEAVEVERTVRVLPASTPTRGPGSPGEADRGVPG